MSLASTSLVTAKKGFDLEYADNYAKEAKDHTEKIWTAVKNVADNFYGKMFAMAMPEEPGGKANNLRFITEDQKYETSWEAVDSAYSPADKFRDVSFFDASGRVKTFAEWTYKENRDFSDLGSQYAKFSGSYYLQNTDTLSSLGEGVASTGCSIEKSSYFFNLDGQSRPYVVMNANARVVEYDKITTPDFGLTVLAKYFFGINIPPENYIGPGKPNTQISIPPKVVPPNSFGIAQQSNRYVWGPWMGGSLKGKSEIITDDGLVPESFGSVDGLNQAGEALATVDNAKMGGSETGYVELAEFPAYNIAERFAGGGPYVSDMSFNIDTSGFKTTYQFNTWTPQFGKLAKYNIDRISRINKASLELLKRERDKVTKRPFLPITQNSRMEELSKRQNRQDNSLSLAQIFPPMGGKRGTSQVSKISTSDLGAMSGAGSASGGGAGSDTFQRTAGASDDTDKAPVETSKKKSKDNDYMSSLETPEIEDEPEGGVLPDSEDLCPYFSKAINEDDGTGAIEKSTVDGVVAQNEAGEPPSDSSLDKLDEDEKKAISTDKVPRIFQGWGYDVAYNPVPNDGGNLRKFDPTFQEDPKLLKSGPFRPLWDEERKIWTGGLEILCGVLDTDITPAETPLSPSNFDVSILRKTAQNKGEGALEESNEIVTCYNRDTNLTASSGEDVFVIIIRLNYEWTPLWVSCTE